jgi:hypothetical protein
VARRLRSIEKFNEFIGNRTRDLPACSILAQPTTLLHNIFAYRSKVSKPYVCLIVHIVYMNSAIYLVTSTRISCVCVAPEIFNSPLCCRVVIINGLPDVRCILRAV